MKNKPKFELTMHKEAAVDLALRNGDAEVKAAFELGRKGGEQATVWPNKDRARFYAYKFAYQALQDREKVLSGRAA